MAELGNADLLSAHPFVSVRLAVEAATKALLDAGINYDEVEQAFAGYVYGVSLLLRSRTSLFAQRTNALPIQDSTCGQRALYALGLTAIPIINVNNKCVAS